ncbi:MAG: CehA/McbA family metallohydrolase [Candidatus Eremiobacterota bacterium]
MMNITKLSLITLILLLLISSAYAGNFTVINPYDGGGTAWYKGQLHCHTDNSDGKNDPEEVVEAYKEAGYNFIAITDHNFITPDPLIEGITFISGVEETLKRHLVAINVEKRYEGKDIQECLDFHFNDKSMIFIAHPEWRKRYIMCSKEVNSYNNFNFIEVFNTGIGYSAEDPWDFLLSNGRKIFALATDDCHNVKGRGFNRGYVMVKADSSGKEDILKSLRNGNFYASTGNDMEITVEGDTIIAKSSNSSIFDFKGKNGEILKNDGNVNESRYTITGDEMYIRVRACSVPDGKMAWSQPIFIQKN